VHPERILPILALLLLAACPTRRGTDDTVPPDDDDSGAFADDDDSATVDDDDDTEPPPPDTDGDGVLDPDDACPDDPLQWTDADGDGVCDEVDDDCPDDPAGWADTNGDGLCDGDDDIDGDGISNAEELSYGADCAISDPLVADTDLDGIADNDDLYPRDPYPEYLLFRNDTGTIDLMLSNRDGTFQPAEVIGLPFGDTSNTDYRYTGFVISDFDNNGTTDFLAHGDADPTDPDNPVDLWWFGRVAGPTSFTQRLVEANIPATILQSLADVDGDEDVDLIRATRTPTGGTISTLVLHSYLNANTIATAECAWTDDPANPAGCAFVRVFAIDLTSWADGQWVYRLSRDAVDVDGDGSRDLLFVTHDSGGNSRTPVLLLSGNGDGTFTLAPAPFFQHNESGDQCPVNTIVFADFDGDGLGDVIVGLDDDGDAGSAWFYPGQYTPADGFSFDTASAFESFDLNPGAEGGGENYGVTGSSRGFDWDFDGFQDLLVGYNYTQPWDPPSKTVWLQGNGDGTFQPEVVIRTFADSSFGQSFAIPQRLCQRFSIETE
jgi:hypothetical protein